MEVRSVLSCVADSTAPGASSASLNQRAAVSRSTMATLRASAIFNFWMLYSVSKTSTYFKSYFTQLMNDTRAVLRCFPDIWPYLSPRSLVNQTAGRWFKDRGSLVGEGACMVR